MLFHHDRPGLFARQAGDRSRRVVFLRLPSCGAVRELEGHAWPREKYRDVYATATSASTVHSAGYPPLSGFACPDGSHRDQRDAPRFTRVLRDAVELSE